MSNDPNTRLAWDSSAAVVRLDAVREEDLNQLYAWMNDLDELPLWSVRRKQLLYQDVVDYVQDRSRSGLMTLIRYRETGAPIGFVEGVVRDRDGVGDFLLFIGHEWRGRRLVLQALGLFGRHIFTSFPLRKIYCHGYAFHDHSLALMREGGFVEEGRFKDHIWWNDRYWDMHVLSLDRASWEAGERGDGGVGRFLKAARLLRLRSDPVPN